MDQIDLVRSLKTKNDTKIVMFVGDGLGGLPHEPGGQTELEAAKTPNLDALAAKSVQGASIPVKPGIAPGSGPGHLGLFGYDPLKFLIGRGALEATGIGLPLQPGDVAVRCNFCTIDADGKITDRRAGRIPTEESAPLAESLNAIKIPGVEVIVKPVKEHRFVVIFRGGEGLGGNVHDTDPQATGVLPLDPVGVDEPSKKTAEIAKQFVEAAKKMLKDEKKANCLTMRGFSAKPDIPTYEDVYGLNAAAIAVYPMYKGLASLVGMEILGEPQTLEEEIKVLEENWDKYDFFFIHFKYTDSSGEDGDFDAKVKRTEEFDAQIPRILALNPDVVIVTGDHSTPSFLASHSWHPVPTLLYSNCCRPDGHKTFGENTAITGGLGHFEAQYLMTLAMANAHRLQKYGA